MNHECKIVTVDRQLTAVVKTKAPLDKLPQTQRDARARIDAALPKLGAGPYGPTCTRWRPPVNGVMEMEPGTIVARSFAPVDDVVPSELPAGRAASCTFEGGFEKLPDAWQALFAWCASQRLTLRGVNWEVYRGVDEAPSQQGAALYALIE